MIVNMTHHTANTVMSQTMTEKLTFLDVINDGPADKLHISMTKNNRITQHKYKMQTKKHGS